MLVQLGDLVGGDEPARVLGTDHDPVEDVLVRRGDDVVDRADLDPVRRVHGHARFQAPGTRSEAPRPSRGRTIEPPRYRRARAGSGSSGRRRPPHPRRGRSAPARSQRSAPPRRPPPSVSPTWSAADAGTPASASARSKIAGSGLRAPTSAEVTTPSRYGVSPTRSSTSCSETSQFETTTSRAPALTQPRQRTRRASGERAGSEATRAAARRSRRRRARARGRSRGSASTSTSAQRRRSAASAAGSRPSSRCAR